ncbi:MAG TPA: YfhO family protein, partial [Pirellulales bacterium]|nr:YfhO family protein [Pirellulales bacterium]
MKIALHPRDLPQEAGSGSGDNSEPRRLNSHEFSYRSIAILSLTMMVALAGPFLAGRVYTADDLGAFHLPLRAFYADCLAHGEAWDWSPQLFCGFYLTGEGQVGGYHPLHLLLYRFLPLPLAFDLECLLSYPFMLVGMYLLLRRWGVRRDAALAGGFAFAFSGFSLLHFIHVNGIAVVAHLPWLLLAIDWLLRGTTQRRRLFAGAVLALLTASQWLLGYPQYVMLSMIAEFGYAALIVGDAVRHEPTRAAGNQPRAGRRKPPDAQEPNGKCRLIKGLAIVAAWSVVGAILGGVQLLPTIDALQNSSRSAADANFSGWGSLHPLNLIQFVAPYLFKTRVVGQNTHELGLYSGSATLLLAVWALVVRPAASRLRLLRRGAALLVILGLVFAFGEFAPIHWILARLPLVNRFRFPCRAIVLVHFGLAALAALGFGSLIRAGTDSQHTAADRRRGQRLIWLVVAIGVFAAIGGPMLWPEFVAPAALVWLGPVISIAAASLIGATSRCPKPAVLALALLWAIDLGAYGLSYSVYSETNALDRYVAAIPVPPAVPMSRVALDWAPANRPSLHSGNAIVLTGWNRADGYAGLEPAKQLDYRTIPALRAADVGWIKEGANLADNNAIKHRAAGWL